MTTSALKEKFGRLEPIRRAVRVQSGSPKIVTIRVGRAPRSRDSIAAIASLHRHGLTVLRAKRSIEAVLAEGKAIVALPLVPNVSLFVEELGLAGFAATVRSRYVPRVQALRERLGLTQEQFALRFGLELDALRNWEHGRREPDAAARSLLKVIDRFPENVADALES